MLMLPQRITPFWRSYLITAVAGLVLLPLATDAFIDYHGQAVDIYATSTVTAAGAPAVAIQALNTDALAVNAFEIELSFDPAQLQLSSSTVASPLCEDRFVISNHVDNERGTALIQCGTITPFTGTSTTLAVFSMTNATNTSSLTFGSRTNILAHDGYGTNVTGSTTIALP